VLILSSCAPSILRKLSISPFIRSSICRTALTSLRRAQTLEREANGEMFGELDQNRLIGFVIGRLCSEFGKGLLQDILRANGQLRIPGDSGISGNSRARCPTCETGQRGQNAVHLRFAGIEEAPGPDPSRR